MLRRDHRWLEFFGLYNRVGLLALHARCNPFKGGTIKTLTTNLGLANIREPDTLLQELRRTVAGTFLAISHFYPEDDEANAAAIRGAGLSPLLFRRSMLGYFAVAGWQVEVANVCKRTSSSQNRTCARCWAACTSAHRTSGPGPVDKPLDRRIRLVLGGQSGMDEGRAEMAELRGESVTLRALNREDLPALQRWLDVPDVGLFVGHQQGPVGLADIEHWFAQIVADESQRAYAVRNDAGDLVGYCVIKLTWEHREAHLGAICIDPAAQGHGYGGDALRTLIRFLFDELGVHRVSTGTHAVNESAIRLYQKIGFVREGTLREKWFHAGTWHDAALFGLLRADFEGKAAQ